jgi:hypothetical protein
MWSLPKEESRQKAEDERNRIRKLPRGASKAYAEAANDGAHDDKNTANADALFANLRSILGLSTDKEVCDVIELTEDENDEVVGQNYKQLLRGSKGIPVHASDLNRVSGSQRVSYQVLFHRDSIKMTLKQQAGRSRAARHQYL